MASRSRRRTENAPGEFYVDSTCIHCNTCRWMAPEAFDRAGSQSRVQNSLCFLRIVSPTHEGSARFPFSRHLSSRQKLRT